MNGNQTPIGILGIMACETEGEPPFADKEFFARLCELGRRLGLLVYVFSPERLDAETGAVTGYRYLDRERSWVPELFPLPDLIYDRSFYREPGEYERHRRAVRRMLNVKEIPYLSRSLSGKWEVLGALSRYPELRPHLPATRPLADQRQLLAWLDKHGEAIVKPSSGTHGKGVLHIVRKADGFVIRGRDLQNGTIRLQIREPFALVQWLNRFAGTRPYLLQQYLQLTTKAGEPFDIRSLAQKNGSGRWAVTGMAVRRGAAGGVTSNLHGGGHAEPLQPFLADQLGPQLAQLATEKLLALSRMIPETLERHFGRLAELGIDLGVDRAGRVWIVEVNSKPGRSAFQTVTEHDAGLRSVANPVSYARFMLGRPQVRSRS